MKALRIEGVTPAGEAEPREVAVPQTKPGWLLVRVRGFGLNHSEQVLRLGEINAPYVRKPVTPGIECVGEVADPGDTRFVRGQHVCALMGGMGRSFDGSYAEYALLPEHHVFALPESASELDWDVLAAIPETFYTAWGSLFEGLRLQKGDSLLVRGGTCALGFAAIQIAKALGCRVIATAHREKRLSELTSLGCDAIIDDGRLAEMRLGCNKVLELVGASTLRDSLMAVRKGGIVCQTGILGGEGALSGFDVITGIPNGVFLTGFYSNYPDQETMSEIFDFVAKHGIRPVVAKVFRFDDLCEALRMQDTGGFAGKIVVTNKE
ncbi:zinc-binding dehydrogenase [Collinsella aerofaciens]